MLKLGDKNISKIYYGDKAISKVFKGDTLILSSGGSGGGHTEIEYLEGDKTSFINTGVIGQTGVSIDIDFYYPNANMAGETHIIGCRDNTYRFYPAFMQGTRFASRLGTNAIRTGNANVIKTGRHRFLAKTSQYQEIGVVVSGTKESYFYYGAWEYVDGALVPRGWYDGTNSICNTNVPMYLFGINLANDGAIVGNSYFTDTTGYIRIHACKIWTKNINNEDVLVRDYIPVERADGVKCLFDKVESKYYEFQTA